MRRSQREARREQAEALRQQRAQNKATQAHNEALREGHIQKALQSSRQASVLDRSSLLSRLPRGRDGQTLLTPKLEGLLRFLERKAPRLLEPEYVAALHHISQLSWQRPVEEWKPKGKGRDTLFRGLCAHLLAKYPMPTILWGTFFEKSVEALAPVAGYVAAGGSLFTAVQDGRLTPPLTRKMCHELLSTPGEKFVEALRRAQILALDGDPMLHQAWMATEIGALIHPRPQEEFWLTVLRWFCQNPLLDRRQTGPLIDYINFRRRQDPSFSMKGRSAIAMLRGMTEWHGDLAKEKAIKGTVFKPSGFKGFEYTRKVKVSSGGDHEEHWAVSEILTSKQLAAEGRALRHCVYSYAWQIQDGHTSIWSMTLDGDKMITAQVRNSDFSIVQARGKTNRAMTGTEHRILLLWAQANNLTIGVRL